MHTHVVLEAVRPCVTHSGPVAAPPGAFGGTTATGPARGLQEPTGELLWALPRGLLWGLLWGLLVLRGLRDGERTGDSDGCGLLPGALVAEPKGFAAAVVPFSALHTESVPRSGHSTSYEPSVPLQATGSIAPPGQANECVVT